MAMGSRFLSLCKEGSLEEIKTLTNGEATLVVSPMDIAAGIDVASENGHVDIVRHLVENVSSAAPYVQGVWGHSTRGFTSPLHLAVSAGHIEVKPYSV